MNPLRVRRLLAALDPVLLPLFLELGSILFFAAGLLAHAESVGGRERAVEKTEENVWGPWALEDLLTLSRARRLHGGAPPGQLRLEVEVRLGIRRADLVRAGQQVPEAQRRLISLMKLTLRPPL